MHKLVYETGEGRAVAHCQNADTNLISTDECFDTNFEGKLPGTFKRRGSKVFCTRKVRGTSNTMHFLECHGKIRFCDLKRFILTVFDAEKIARINGGLCFAKNKNLIVKLASEILGEEALDILANRQ